MYTFKNDNGTVRGKTLTKKELIAILDKVADDTPIMATWEHVDAYFERFEVRKVAQGGEKVNCLVFDVGEY